MPTSRSKAVKTKKTSRATVAAKAAKSSAFTESLNDPEQFFVQQRGNKWCCMERLPNGSDIEHVCFKSERAANFHLLNFHSQERVMAASGSGSRKRTLDARPDTLDFRDRMYEAALYEVPVEIDLKEYKKYKVPILDQGTEGACTGYGLATVANYLLLRRKFWPDPNAVSARMLYVLAKRYDEWAGEGYSGSSARGAMKGWHKHGLCQEKCYPNDTKDDRLNDERTSDAVLRPLGAYYRVNHKDLVSMHSAMAEVGILYATATVHQGWNEVGANGIIPFTEKTTGGHAFAIVAYDKNGFWIQNSWGNKWGKGGFGLISYDDWLKNGSDVWVARLGAPVTLMKTESIAITHSASSKKSNAYSFSDLRPHIISLGNDGVLNNQGEYGTSAEEVKSIFEEDFIRVTKNWKKKRLLLYAHGGLVAEANAVQRVADYRKSLLEAEVYPVAFVWRTDAWTTITNILQDVLRRRKPEGILDSAKDFMLDRLDDALEPVARKLTGKLQWDEMKENALLATRSKGGGVRATLQHVADLAKKFKDDFEIHLIGHSAGSILLAPMVQKLTAKGKIPKASIKDDEGYGLPVKSCTLWAPACTIELFKQYYMPSVLKKTVERFAVFNLTDEAERDDHCAHIYNKSLLYLVSNAFEEKQRIPIFGPAHGTPLLGMEKFIEMDEEVNELFESGKADLVLAPNSGVEGSPGHSTCSTHGGFDDDTATVRASLSRILDIRHVEAAFDFKRSEASLKDRRSSLNLKAS